LKQPGNCANLFPKQPATIKNIRLMPAIVELASHIETNLESTGEKAGG
jgi:hypothetical protein